MAIAAALTRQSTRDKTSGKLTALFTLTASSSYSTTEALDFATVVGFTNKQPDLVVIVGNSGFLYGYDKTNKYFKVYGQTPNATTAGQIGLVELAAGAYPAGITGDTILAEVTWYR